MHRYYRNYYWDHGRPRGEEVVEAAASEAFRIVVDPYYKRYTIERYKEGLFSAIVYDSALYDFRWLKPQEQVAWRKEVVSEDKERMCCLIRNQDERVIALESYSFQEGLCRSCKIYYPGGALLAEQRICYTKLGDDDNSVTLNDSLGRPIVVKRYHADEESGEFTELVDEKWECRG